LQVVGLGGVHLDLVLRLVIVVAHEVERAVDYVEQEFIVRRPTGIGGFALRCVGTDDEFDFDAVV
jgi:hypothetical protein